MNLSFIKLDINIMNDTKIKKVRSMPGGSDMIVLWIGLLCLAMKSGKPGLVEIGDGIPFTASDLANEFDLSIDTVSLALITFEKLKMIEVFNNNEIFISNFEKHQELTRIERAKEVSRKSSEKYRSRMKQLTSGDGHVTISDDIDKEIDKEKEIDYTSEIEQIGIRCYGRTLKPIEIDAIEQYIRQYSLKTVQNTAKSCGLLGWKSIKSLGNALEDPTILDKRDSFNDKTPQKVSYNYLLSNPELMDKYKIIKPGLPNDVENWELK